MKITRVVALIIVIIVPTWFLMYFHCRKELIVEYRASATSVFDRVKVSDLKSSTQAKAHFIGYQASSNVSAIQSEIISSFMMSPSLIGATVITRSDVNWSRDKIICENDVNFVETVLRSPAGITPIFVHSLKDDMWVSGTVIKGGIWESNEVNKFYRLLKTEADLQFLDIGGNIGVYGLTIAKLGRKVVFVEPLLKNVYKLCQSVRKGNFKDTYVIHNALSSKRFKIGFGTYKGNIGGTYIRNVTSDTEETAQAVLLDDLLEIFAFTKVAIKMDVETHEALVLLGANSFFSKVDVRYMLMEWGPHKNKPDGQTIIDFLSLYKMQPYHPQTDRVLQGSNYNTWPNDVFWKKII